MVTTEERIITAAVVTSREKGGGSELPKFLEITKQNSIAEGAIIRNEVYLGKEIYVSPRNKILSSNHSNLMPNS